MASLKEIKSRITSVRNTQKITSAMRMVASAKLHRVQNMAQNLLYYTDELHKVLSCVQTVRQKAQSVKAVAIITFSSSSGLCGAFNSNIIKETRRYINEYREMGTTVYVFPVGKKIANDMKKDPGLSVHLDFCSMNEQAEKGNVYAVIQQFTAYLTELYDGGKIQRVEMVYHHFKSMGKQVIQRKTLTMEKLVAKTHQENLFTEPSPQELADALHPKLLNAELYSTLLDTICSEHAARMLAMQTADDNVNELLGELTLLYNKTRQQAITNELIDIVGGNAG
ncbi:MAG: ATP synthase F1 subunit gamma [Bacteroidaceae bacterium]|nr:ATP synthase F1 subunit gamma [Bacteroidaceae bacterium]